MCGGTELSVFPVRFATGLETQSLHCERLPSLEEVHIVEFVELDGEFEGGLQVAHGSMTAAAARPTLGHSADSFLIVRSAHARASRRRAAPSAASRPPPLAAAGDVINSSLPLQVDADSLLTSSQMMVAISSHDAGRAVHYQ